MAYPSFRFKPNDIYTDILDGDISAATDPINTTDNTNAESGPCLIKIDNEIIKCTTKGANNFSTLERGYNGTTAASHSSGAVISHPISADIFVKMWEAIEAIYGGALDIVTAKGDILVASAADTLTKLAIGADKTLLNVATDTPAWIAPASLGKVGDSDTVDTVHAAAMNQLAVDQTIASVKTYDEGAVAHAPKGYNPAGAATATLDVSLGNNHEISMPAGNITIAISNETNGQFFIISILQDGGGSRTVTWFTTIKWAGGSAPTLTTTGGKRDLFGFKCTGTDTYDGFIIGQNV
ncbi:hypothetical protein CMI37_05270 [Candidatus Pacearchaeota archaeon]|nr:hypothetical protein [Candidatus Pacearchaeota archaeon]